MSVTLPPPPREQTNPTQRQQWVEALYRKILELEADRDAGGIVGDHKLWFSDTLPTSGTWVWCDGTDYAADDYPEWYAIHGDRFGSPSAGRFNTLDARGRFMRFWDNGAGRDPNAADRTAMASGGESGDEIGSVQDEAYKSHNHTGSTGSSFGTDRGNGGAGGGGGPGNDLLNNTNGSNDCNAHTHTVTINSSGDDETRPVNFYGALITRLA